MSGIPTVRYLPDWHLHQGHPTRGFTGAHIQPDKKRVGLGTEYERKFAQGYREAERSLDDPSRQPMRPVIVRRAK